jgi:hypothetical protein
MCIRDSRGCLDLLVVAGMAELYRRRMAEIANLEVTHCRD